MFCVRMLLLLYPERDDVDDLKSAAADIFITAALLG
jgi:hypothetical protein